MHITKPDHEYQTANPFSMKDDQIQKKNSENSFKLALLIQAYTVA